jgi:hypothetical protein
VPARPSRFTLVLTLTIGALVLGTDVVLVAASDRSAKGAANVCPSPENTRRFGDARDRCATAATALPVGRVPVSELPCWVPSNAARFKRGTSSVSVTIDDPGEPPHGWRICDTLSTPGLTLYFDFNTTHLNDPTFSDYDPRLPIGVVIDRTRPACRPARACQAG